MNNDQLVSKGNKTKKMLKERMLWLFVAVLGVIIMPFMVVYQLITLLRQYYPKVRASFEPIGLVLMAALSYIPEFIYRLQKKKPISSKH